MNELMKFFPYDDNNNDHTRIICSYYHYMASNLNAALPDCPEKTVALRKLLESKDAAYRAKLNK